MLNPLNKFGSFKEEWRLKSPKQKWLFVHNIAAKSSELIGIRVFTDARVTWFSFLSLGLAIVHLSDILYTVWIHYNNGEFLLGLQSTCTLGMFVMILTIYYKSIGPDRLKTNMLVTYAGKYIYMDDKQPSRYNEHCERMVADLVKSVIIIVSAIIVSYTAIGVGVFYALIFGGKRVALLGVEIPFVDIDTDDGYMITLVSQSVVACAIFVGNIAIEIGACIAYNTVSFYPGLIHLESGELRNELKSNGMSLRAEKRVRHIFMLVQDVDGYSREAIEVYYMRLFAGPFLLTFSISYSIFSQMILGYPAGYGFAMCNYILLIISCYLGENLNQVNESIGTELYNMPWYYLSTSCQKEISFAIHWMQNGATFSIGPFAKLNFETASDLTRQIFRLTMLLFKLFK